MRWLIDARVWRSKGGPQAAEFAARLRGWLTPSRVVICAFCLTAIIAYVHSILFALGASAHELVSPFFVSSDLFADYFKLISSYPSRVPFHLESWVPVRWAVIIRDYLSCNPYKNDPALIGSHFAHFGLPPAAQVFYVLSGKLFAVIGPFSSFLLCLVVVASWLAWCLQCSVRRWRKTAWLLPVTLLLYPSVLAITRGNISACVSALAVASAFLAALRPQWPVVMPALFMSLAIGFRPNYFLLLPICCLLSSFARPRLSRVALLVLGAASAVVSMALFMLLLHCLYPAFDGHRFLDSYRWISSHYDLDRVNVAYLASPLQILNLMLLGPLQSGLASFSVPGARLLSLALLAVGVTICASAYHLCARRELGISASILASIIGMIIATPWFADYHLMVLLVPLLCATLLAEMRRTGEASNGLGGGIASIGGRFDSALGGVPELGIGDACVIMVLLVPKSFPLFSTGATIGTLVNPVIMFIYVVLLFLPRWLRPSPV